MKTFLNLMILLSVFVLSNVCYSSEVSPNLVRIRMHKELIEFPEIRGAKVRQLGENIWSVSGDGLRFNNKILPHNNFISRKSNGRFDIISVLEFNEYLAGVVGNEMPVSWPLEALKAQAVVARSYALAKISERSSRLFHLDSDQSDQVYLLSQSAKTKLAVSSTERIILRAPNGSILKAYFHADCGGQTVPASQIWGPKAIDSGTAVDPWCADKKNNQWNFEIAKNEFFEKLNIPDSGPQESYFTNKEQLLLIGQNLFSVQKLREIFGFFKIRSSLDSIEVTDDKVKMTGQGFGHGAGLCQWGTLAQVRMGKSYIKVLEHYYPRAKIAQNVL